MKSKNPVLERIYLTKDEFLNEENSNRYYEHLRRYAAVRRFCYGKTLDFACGCGYGSNLIAANPEVTQLVGIDINKEAVNWAKNEFGHKKINYVEADISEVNEPFDTLVCLETIEHIKDISTVQLLVERCDVKNLIISFPDKKSTHFNSYHFHDFVKQDVIDLFTTHVCYHEFRSGDVQFLLFIKLPNNAPFHIFRNIIDLG